MEYLHHCTEYTEYTAECIAEQCSGCMMGLTYRLTKLIASTFHHIETGL